MGGFIGSPQLYSSQNQQQPVHPVLDLLLLRIDAVTLYECPLHEIPEPIWSIVGTVRGKIDPEVKGFVHKIFLRVKLMKQGNVLVDLAFPVNLPVFPLSVIRPGNIIDLTVDDLLGSHMREKPAGKSNIKGILLF